MRNRLLLILVFVFLFGGPSVSSAAENTVDPREAAVDRAIGGMEEGSRPLEPQSYMGKNQGRPIPNGSLSPTMDTRATASAPAGANLGANTSPGTESGNLQGGAQETVGGGTTTSPGGSTEPAGGSIVNVDASVDLSGDSPTVDANLNVDTNAGNLLDANAGAETDTISVDAAATESGTAAGQDLTTTVNEAPVDAVFDTEVAATDIPAESEATAGLEADVDPVTADGDVAPSDPADGLSAGL